MLEKSNTKVRKIISTLVIESHKILAISKDAIEKSTCILEK